MKSSQVTLIIIGFIVLALMATNPTIEDHREGVKEMYKKKLGEMNKDKQNNLGYQIGTGLGMMIGDGFIDKIVSRDNYLLFSLTKATVGNKTQNIGFGVLGQVYIQDNEKIKSKIGGDRIVDESETKLHKQNSNWIGDYNNYDSSIPNYMGFGYCNPGNVDIEIKLFDNGLHVIFTSKGERMGETWNVRNEYEVIESTNNYLWIKSKGNETGSIFEYKILKKDEHYYVKNITQQNCDDYEIVKTSF
jgi:hypothetical protein